MSIEQDEKSPIDRTQHHQTATKIVDKMHDPQNMHDKIIHSNIPRNLVANLLILHAGEHGLRKLTEGAVTVEWTDKSGQEKVTIMRESEVMNADGTHQLLPYRTISRTAYRDNQFWADFWQGISGTLEEELMAIPVKKDEGGWRGEQAEREIGSLVTGERQLMEAASQNKPNYVRRVLNAVRGK